MHDAPPDMLLTNYKMLDHLLLHPGRAEMWRQSAESLQYLVLDEFHTYDGAQGTDVAMLLRRLGLTLKSHWTETSNAHRRGPTPTARPDHPGRDLGDPGSRTPSGMLDFAYTVFGEEFDADAVITETRLTLDEWLDNRVGIRDNEFHPVDPALPDALNPDRKEPTARRGQHHHRSCRVCRAVRNDSQQ